MGMDASQDTSAAAPAIRHDVEGRRFSTIVEGEKGFVAYELDGEVMTITHTLVPPAIGGRGIAGHLVQAALDFARAEGLKVRPQCSYTDAWMRKHPDYDVLRAA